jgi:hypothetical protein
MRKKLTKCRNGQLNQFGYRSILVSLFLERVLVLRLYVEWGIPTPQDIWMKRWVDLMDRHGGVPIANYDKVFFQWMRNQLIMVEDYSYARTDFCGDPDLALPEGYQWEDIGKKEIFIYMFFFIFKLYKKKNSFIQD